MEKPDPVSPEADRAAHADQESDSRDPGQRRPRDQRWAASLERGIAGAVVPAGQTDRRLRERRLVARATAHGTERAGRPEPCGWATGSAARRAGPGRCAGDPPADDSRCGPALERA